MAQTNQAPSAVERTISEAAMAGERLLSITRLGFCVLVGARATFYWIAGDTDHTLERALITYPALAIAVAASVLVLNGAPRAWSLNRVLHASVVVDTVVAFTVLLPNSIWPGPNYLGAPFLIDTAALLVITVASGLRHSQSAAILAGGLNCLALGGLLIADQVPGKLSTDDLWRGYSMYAVLLCAMAALSWLIAVRSRALVERAAQAAVAADNAGRGLQSLLRDHHDLRSAITSAQVNTDLLERTLDGDRSPEISETVSYLREDLAEIRAQVEQVKQRALEELAGLQQRSAVQLEPAIRNVVTAILPRFPGVAFHGNRCDRAVLVAGGEHSLRRILANLLINACEGDGRRGATHLQLDTREPTSGRVAIELVDDGPGLPAHLLEGAIDQALSTKPRGTGVGTTIVDALVRASGGSLRFRNQPGGGARVVVELPAAD